MMLVSKRTPWTRTVAKELSKPVFPQIPLAARPYLLALTLFAAAGALMYAGNAALPRYGLSWALVALLMVVATANLWGVRAAILVLMLSALYSVVIVSYLPPPPPLHLPRDWHVQMIRTSLFCVCGAATIWLTYRARLMQVRAETRRGVVAALRSTIQPTALAPAPGYDLSGVYNPLHDDEEVGGDFYDFYPIEAGRYGLLIGDVVGKGKEAAASIALLRYSVRAFSSSGAHPAQIISQLNRMIEAQGLQFEMATLFLGILDSRSGSLCYVNAGHEPPLLKRAEGEEEILDSTGPILGIGPDIAYEEKKVLLGMDDALLLMTDGVTEARNEQGKFLSSTGAWRMFRTALRAPSAGKALSVLNQTLTAYIGTNRCDDIAMLLLRRTSEISEQPPHVLIEGTPQTFPAR